MRYYEFGNGFVLDLNAVIGVGIPESSVDRFSKFSGFTLELVSGKFLTICDPRSDLPEGTLACDRNEFIAALKAYGDRPTD